LLIGEIISSGGETMKEVRGGRELKLALDARDRARGLRKTMTSAEQILWESLRGRKLAGLKFRRQFPVSPFVLDFYCQELMLVIELDGEVHAEPSQTAHDENRDGYLKSLGCTILRFPNEAVLHNLPAVLKEIVATASSLTSPP
jgi:very-short-patch-repair endonuclease